MLIRCPKCGKPLGEIVAGMAVIRYRRREVIGVAYSIRCERCGAVWRPESQGDDMPEAAKYH